MPPDRVVVLAALAMPRRVRAPRAHKATTAQRDRDEDSIGLEADRADPHPGQVEQARECARDAHGRRPPVRSVQRPRTYGPNLCASPPTHPPPRKQRRNPAQPQKPAPGSPPESPTIIHGASENRDEVAFVRQLFPGARDYLETYERPELVCERTVFAHDVHPTNSELERLASASASVVHCPSSNAFLGSGIFPLRLHLHYGVHCCLGSDVGAGTGPSLLKEGLAAYQMQMLATGPQRLGPAELLYLATRAGAQALGLHDHVGDLTPGRSADYLLLRPPSGSTLEFVMSRSQSWEALLGAVFALGGEDTIAEVRVAGEPVFSRPYGPVE